MAKLVCVLNDGNVAIKDTYAEAIDIRPMPKIFYLAPDASKKWRPGHPKYECECWVLHLGEPVLAKYIPSGTEGIYWFVHYGTYKAVRKTDGWLPGDWFRYFQADGPDMERWQDEDEYGDADDYGDLGPVDCYGNYVL